jgi:hypothetical protein
MIDKMGFTIENKALIIINKLIINYETKDDIVLLICFLFDHSAQNNLVA